VLQVPAFWLGGMATHGLLLGGVAGILLFCFKSGKSFLAVADEIVIPGAFFLGIGRMGNFIDGQILGRVSDVWWAVRFPDAEGFRHPVVLYDGLKNLLLIPLLLYIRRRRSAQGIAVAHFIFWYAFLRIFVDLHREYETTLAGIATGQGLNILMSVLGLSLFLWLRRKRKTAAGDGSHRVAPPAPERFVRAWPRKVAFAVVVLFSLTIPSDRTQDVPARYGKRHAGMRYSFLYPRVEMPTLPPPPSQRRP